MYRRRASGEMAMPRGFVPALNVAVTLSVAVSMTEIDAEPSFETYAKGAASAAAQTHSVAPTTIRNSPGTMMESFGCPAGSSEPQLPLGAIRAPSSAGYATRLHS